MKTKRKIILLIIDCGIIALSYAVTSLLLNDGTFFAFPSRAFVSISVLLALYLVYSTIFQIYNSIWRYAEGFDFLKIVVAMGFCTLTFTALDYLFIHNENLLMLNIYSSITSVFSLTFIRIDRKSDV